MYQNKAYHHKNSKAVIDVVMSQWLGIFAGSWHCFSLVKLRERIKKFKKSFLKEGKTKHNPAVQLT